jgi:hypothetical protein
MKEKTETKRKKEKELDTCKARVAQLVFGDLMNNEFFINAGCGVVLWSASTAVLQEAGV